MVYGSGGPGLTAQEGYYRVNRGGSWNNNPDNPSSANRNNNDPGNRNNNLGLRVLSIKDFAR
ncbi:MAG: hypothetical protein H7839_24175 [Magnetococcus sp. YQC-5]